MDEALRRAERDVVRNDAYLPRLERLCHHGAPSHVLESRRGRARRDLLRGLLYMTYVRTRLEIPTDWTVDLVFHGYDYPLRNDSIQAARIGEWLYFPGRVFVPLDILTVVTSKVGSHRWIFAEGTQQGWRFLYSF